MPNHRTKNKEIGTNSIVTSDNPYGSGAGNTSMSKVVNILSKNGQRLTAIIVVVLIGGIGTYLLASSHAANTYGPITGIAKKCLDNWGQAKVNYNKIDLYQCNSTVAQQWTYDTASNGTGTIVNQNGFCLDVDGAGTSSMTLVDLYQCNSTVAQVWEVNPTTGTIINPHSGLCLDDKAASTNNGNQIWIYTCNGTAAQKWVVTASSTPPSSTPPSTTTPPTTTSGVAPTISSAANVTLTAGQAGSFTVKDTGTPAPTLSESGTLPSGISFNSTSGVLSGTTSATGTYKISFTASNGVSPNAVQSFVLAVVSAPTTVGGGGGSSSSCSSPFVKSYFCQPVTNDTVLSNSTSLVTDLVNQYTQNYGTVNINADTNYAIPIYRASASQSLSQVSFDSANCSGDGSFGSFEVPVPSGAVPAQGTDHSLIVYQASTNTDWEFWEFQTMSGGYGACAGGEITSVSTSNGVFPTSGGQLASSGISYLATMITESDIQSGAINHAIAIQLIYCNGSFVAPARTNYDCSGGSIPYGQYFRFPSSLAMPSGLTPLGQMVFKAIQTYGIVVTDHAGAVTLEGEDPAGWDLTNNTTDNPIADAMDGQASYSVITGFPWADLQAINSPSLP